MLASGKATQSAAPTVLPNNSDDDDDEGEEVEEDADSVESSASMTENADWNRGGGLKGDYIGNDTFPRPVIP